MVLMDISVKMIGINESGLYELIFGSRKPEAKKFNAGLPIMLTLRFVKWSMLLQYHPASHPTARARPRRTGSTPGVT